jgi:hypothetical protein
MENEPAVPVEPAELFESFDSSDSPDSASSRPVENRLSTWHWLIEGCRCGFFLQPRVGTAQPTPLQIAILALSANLMLIIGPGWLTVPGPADFQWREWLFLSWWHFPFSLWFCWAMLYADAKMRPRQAREPELNGLMSWLALSFWIALPCILLGSLEQLVLVHQWLTLNSYREMIFSSTMALVIYALLFTALTRLASRYVVSRGLLVAYVLFLLSINGAVLWKFYQPIWTPEYNPPSERKYLNLTQALFEKQRAIWEEQTRAVLPERKNVLDVYGLVFAPYAAEDVFLRESNMVVDVLRRRFDADGRLLHLLNHAETGETHPWATPENLQRGIDVLAKRMDRKRDILVLYLTSHGARSTRLSANNWPLEVPPVTADKVREMLDASGIRNRIVIVSACYSGTWIPLLSSESTLILTAADSENTSYGCGSLSELTFFGRALFNEQLRQTHSFKTAFEKARVDIEQREKEAGKEGYSNPQIFIGEKIAPVLDALEKRLDSLH